MLRHVSSPMDMKKLVKTKMEYLIELARNSDLDSITYGDIAEMSDDEFLEVQEWRVRIQNNHVIIRIPTLVHQDMISFLISSFCKKCNMDKVFICNLDIPVWQKYSCGTILKKQPDFVVVLDPNSNIVISVVSEIAFLNESLEDLLIEAAEMLNESTSVVYFIAIKIFRDLPFRMFFFIFQRTIQTDASFEARISSKEHPRSFPCFKLGKKKRNILELVDALELVPIFFKRIDDSNIHNDLNFTLEGQYFASGERFITFTIPSENLIGLRRRFYEYHGVTAT